jgi:NADPH-dependent curcumin reductase CurA
MRGFFIYDLAADFPRAERRMAQWIAEGRMRPMEDVLEGFEQVPRALMRLYDGLNTGKQIVRLDPAAR